MKTLDKINRYLRESKQDRRIYDLLKTREYSQETSHIIHQVLQLYDNNPQLSLSQCLYIALLYLSARSYGGKGSE